MKLPKKIAYILFVDAILLIACIPSIIGLIEKSGLPFDYEPDLKVKEVFAVDNFEIEKGWYVSSLNGNKVAHRKDVEFLCDQLPVGAMVVVGIVQKKGESDEITALIDLKPYYSTFDLIVTVTVGAIFIALAVYVLYRKRNEKAGYILHWLLICSAIMILFTYGSTYLFKFSIFTTLRGLHRTAYAFLPALFLHFTFHFPEMKFDKYHRYLKFGYIIAFFLAVLMIFSHSYCLYHGHSEEFGIFIAIDRVVTAWFIILSFLGIVNFLHTYLTTSEISVRKKIQWVFLGTSVGLLSYVALYLVPLLFNYPTLLTESTMIMLTAIAPISFTIAIIRYQIMDIDFIINRSAVYFIVVISLIVLSAFIVKAFADLMGDYSHQSNVPYIVAIVVIALIFQPLKNLVQGVVDKKFFKITYNYKSSHQKFLDAIKNSFQKESVGKITIESSLELIPVDKAAFVLAYPNEKYFEIVYSHNCEFDLSYQAEFFDTVDLKAFSSQVMGNRAYVDNDTEADFKDVEIVNKAGIIMLFVFSASDDMYNLLFVGKKLSRFKFTSEDVTMLRTMNVQAGLELKRIHLHNLLMIKEAEAEKLTELNRLKSYFVSSVSHELKTPLTSIRLFAEILQIQKNIPDEKSNEYLQIIQSECDRLNRLINNVLDFSKIERGIKEYRFSEVELNDIVNSALLSFKYQLKFLKFELEVNLFAGDLYLKADPDAIYEALVNLLSNAMKYSIDNKNISIRTFQNDGYSAILIADKGVGIAPADLEHLFDAFYRAKNDSIRTVKGTGLGLTLVRNIMEAHGGYVDVKSELNKGSEFTLYFPNQSRQGK